MRHALVLAACLLALPAASGSWASPEPDTDGDRMTARVTMAYPGRLVFDVTLVPMAASTLDAEIPPGFAAYSFYAYFGTWVDCDGDGTLGNKTTGILGNYTFAAFSPPDAKAKTACPGSVREFYWIGDRPDARSEHRPSVLEGWGTPPRLLIWLDLVSPDGRSRDVAHVRVLDQDGPTVTLETPRQEGTPKRSVDAILRWRDHSAFPFDPMPDSPQFSNLCTRDTCRGWWSEEVVLLPRDASQLVGERIVAYAPITWADLFANGHLYPSISVDPRSRLFYAQESCDFGSRSLGIDCDASAWPRDEPAPWAEYTLRDEDLLTPATLVLGIAADADRDAMGDAWEREVSGLEDGLDALADLDDDCLLNVGEFAWATWPIWGDHPFENNQADWDQDNWTDGEEVAFWNDPSNDHAEYFSGAPGCPGGDAARAPTSVGLAVLDVDMLANHDEDPLTTVHDPDSDNDTLLDGDEYHGHNAWGFTSDPRTPDTDGDGLSDADEIGPDGLGADPRERDSDADGVGDLEERDLWLHLGEDPRADLDGDGLPALLDVDADGDGLHDGEERMRGTHPGRVDTDGDTMGDGWEVAHALDPLDPSDGGVDPDADGLSNAAEHAARSSPRAADTDGDTLLDGPEVLVLGTDPTRGDTDGDGMPDAWEVAHELDPTDPADADDDPDADGTPSFPWTNLDEYRYGLVLWNESAQGPWPYGTDPHDPDTNGNGIPDGEDARSGHFAGDILLGVDPDDVDADGIPNALEARAGLRVTHPDTDGDGLCDGGRAANCRGPDGESFAMGEWHDHKSSAHAPNTDTDLDGLPDWEDAALGLSPMADPDGDGVLPILDPDSDDDGLSDGLERALGSDPLRADTDGDGLLDGPEHDMGLPLLDPDADDDGSPDGEELTLGTPPHDGDADRDGLPDGHERVHGTDPWDPDTDGDGMPDGFEVKYRLLPLDPTDAALDPDLDLLPNLRESHWDTDPHDPDTDNDFLRDGVEVLAGSHPRTHAAHVWTDHDGDGLGALEEDLAGTDPFAADTDGDGIDDFAETRRVRPMPVSDPQGTFRERTGLPRFLQWDARTLVYESDATVADTDMDGLADGEELARWNAYGPNAVRTDHRHPPRMDFVSNLRLADADEDGLDDGDEMRILGTDPRTNDTDGDSHLDYDEVAAGSDPRDPDSRPGASAGPMLDSDGDGLHDARERDLGTDPHDPDTDDDGLGDLVELYAWRAKLNTTAEAVAPYLLDRDADDDGLLDGAEFGPAILPRRLYFATDPLDPDSDGDGLLDGEEGSNGLLLLSVNQATDLAAGALRKTPRPQLPFAATVTIPGAYGTVFEAPNAGTAGGPPGGGRGLNGCTAQAVPAPDMRDSDGDGLRDGEEWKIGAKQVSNPCSHDGDEDGIPDAIEVRRRPLADPENDGYPALDRDSDNDGLEDAIEDEDRNGLTTAGETHVLDQDTDDDGLTDDRERRDGLNPLNPDTEGDGLPDGLESGLSVPESTLIPAFGTDPRDRLCDGKAVGRTFQPFRGSAGGQTNPHEKDTDEDGLIDGFEDLDGDGVHGITAQGRFGGQWDETIPGTPWRELNPHDPDSDGDGVPDGLELQDGATAYASRFQSGRAYCITLGYLRAANLAPAHAVGYPVEIPLATNPHDPDSDKDGVLDGNDLDPKTALSLVKITRFTFQALEKMDRDSFAPDLMGTLSVKIGTWELPIDIGVIEDFEAEAPRSLLSPDAKLQGPSAGRLLWNGLTLGSPEIALPQDKVDFTAMPDLTKMPIKLELRDEDFYYIDEIDLVYGEGTDWETSALLTGSGRAITLSTEGTVNAPPWWQKPAQLEYPKGGRVIISIETPWKTPFLERVLPLTGSSV